MQQPVGQTWNGGAPIWNGGAGTTGLPAGDGPGLESRSRTSRSRSRIFWHSLGLVSKFEPGIGLGGYGLDYITDPYSYLVHWGSYFDSYYALFYNYFSLPVFL